MKRAEMGVIHGRFQGLHYGHMEYLLEGKKRCNFLYIGITNPDPGMTKENIADLKRSKIEENPFTFYERMIMLRDAMIESGVNRNEFEIVPFPINYPEMIKYYVPMNALFFVTIYDEWGKHKLKTLNELGVKTDLMWTRTLEERFTTGKDVRKLIAADEEWEHLVPKSVCAYIKNNQLDARIKKLKNGNV
jgi:cytidyltransferase-like protein